LLENDAGESQMKFILQVKSPFFKKKNGSDKKTQNLIVPMRFLNFEMMRPRFFITY
jgi:hypothetical protein